MTGRAALLANGAWLLSSLPEAVAFRSALDDVAGTQRAVLLRTLRANAGTNFGRRHGFAGIDGVAAYRERVPLSTFDDYEESVERIANGAPGVLTRDPVTRLVPTSGSTAAVKRIPYTLSLRREFQRGIAPWIAGMFRADPELLAGPAYWSISPPAAPDAKTPAGLPVGFADDSEYLGRLGRLLARYALAVPPEVRLESDVERWRYLTLLHLLRCRSLALISVWHPSFLALLLAPLPGWGDRLANDIARDDPRRAAEIRTHLRRALSPGELHGRLWPDLRLVSCWTDAAAAPYRSEVERLFPGVPVQGKGLVATEGLVSLPLPGLPAPVLAVRSHFFEFLAEDGAVHLAHELTAGARYEVVLTTAGGLYRYRPGDLVDIAGHAGVAPLLRFAGRAADVSDRFGEKLHEEQVRRSLDALWRESDLAPRFAMLAFEPALTAYVLFVEAGGADDSRLAELGPRLDALLSANVHYANCRRLGQLAPLRVFRVDASGVESYYAHAVRRGRRLGDVKLSCLSNGEGWREAFGGHLAG